MPIEVVGYYSRSCAFQEFKNVMIPKNEGTGAGPNFAGLFWGLGGPRSREKISYSDGLKCSHPMLLKVKLR
jgi:hypothetical protein